VGLFRKSPNATPRKAGTTKNLRKLICGAVLLITFGGAGFVVPAAFGHGNGGGHGPHQAGQGPPWGRGPNGAGPPGQLRQQVAAPPQPPAPAQVLQTVHHGNGAGPGHGNGFGHGNGRGNGSARGPVTAPAPSAPSAPPAPRGNGNGNVHHGPNAAPLATAASAAPAPPAAAAPTHPAAPVAAGNASPAANAAVPVPPASAPATPAGATRTPVASLGRGFTAHRRAGSHRAPASTSPTSASSANGSLELTSGGRTGPLSSDLSETGSGTTASPNIVGALAPGTSTLGGSTTGTRTATAAATVRRHKTGTSSSLTDPAATVIQRFINVIPIGVWIALAAAMALAALAGIAALRTGHRFRVQAGQVAAVTAAALTDPLTGVLNRRGFIDAAERELERAGRYGHPMALAFVDIRGLKAVNDTEGHLAGDRLLQRVTTLLHESARTHDVVGRIGGDELAVLLAEQDAAGAAAMTQRVRAQVPAARSRLRLATPWDVTIGTATFPEDGDSLEHLLAAADRRLYEQRGIQLT
jgi:diguanylate cyclase (GGDEF)-like protein